MTSGALTVRPSGLRRAPALQIGRRRRRRRRTVLMRGGVRSAQMERRAKRGEKGGRQALGGESCRNAA